MQYFLVNGYKPYTDEATMLIIANDLEDALIKTCASLKKWRPDIDLSSVHSKQDRRAYIKVSVDQQRYNIKIHSINLISEQATPEPIDMDTVNNAFERIREALAEADHIIYSQKGE